METTYLPIIFTDESGSGSLGLPGFDETHNLRTKYNDVIAAGCSSMELIYDVMNLRSLFILLTFIEEY